MKKTIKIIDLFIKIANGEEVPKKVKYCDLFWLWEERTQDYIYKKNGITEKYLIKDILSGYEQTKSLLRTEVEIIEKDKKIEKIETHQDSEGLYFYDKHCKKIYITCDEINFMFEQFNEIIEAINGLKKGE